ncbi:MAG: HD domain-containing protein [Candidatus Omnitrophica bacterium]|jgi:poly(A) polymerase|nr:HD domain-containing protein [Candidatus Omnitrophota bacterium]
MKKLSPQEKGLLENIFVFSQEKNVQLYLVGGFLRDLLLNRSKINPDIDFCLSKDAISFGKALSRKINSDFVVLDQQHDCCRLLKQVEGKTYTIDISSFRGITLEDDLRLRDFAINAMAIELNQKFLTGKLDFIDPWNGQRDIETKVIRHLAKNTFQDDPLRILRAFSFSAMLDFKISPDTLKKIRKERNKLSAVSFERIREELFKILETQDTYSYIRMMDKNGVLKAFLPEMDVMRKISQGPYHHLDVWEHTLEALKQFDKLVKVNKNSDIKEYWDKEISSGHKRLALIKLAILLHDIGKPKAKRKKGRKLYFHGHEWIGSRLTREISRKMKLSNNEEVFLNKLVFLHLRPGYLADNKTLTDRAAFRFFRDIGNDAPGLLTLSLADQRATRGRLTTKQSRSSHEKLCAFLIKEYFRKAKEVKLPKLVNGNDIMRAFNIKPSELVGKILKEIEEAQAIGKIKDKQEALDFGAKVLKKCQKKKN